jgi:hypothetical protein
LLRERRKRRGRFKKFRVRNLTHINAYFAKQASSRNRAGD